MIARSVFFISIVGPLLAQVSFDRILHAEKEPSNWLTYSGSFLSQRYSRLTQINPRNVHALELQWVFQAQSLEKFEATPLVVDGIMYTVQPPNNVVALDAATGRIFWIYKHRPSREVHNCCGNNNRGLAILGNTLFMGTIDARLIAVDATRGNLLWNIPIARPEAGYSIMHAPLVIKDKVIVGMGGGEYGIRGFIAAYDAKTGKEVWRFHTIPGPGEPGHETWGGDSWMHGSGPVWVTGSYDPELNLTYWGIGNPGPDWNGDSRPGDNLYTDSVVALDADTGKLKWYFQFSPHDEFDYDAVQIPVLVDLEWNDSHGSGQSKIRKVILWANRNGFFYVFDRVTGEFLLGKPFVKVTWARGLDEKGKPVRVEGKSSSPEGTLIFPGVQGGTNWYSPSYSPRTGLFYVSCWEDYSSVFVKWHREYEEGKGYSGGWPRTPIPGLWAHQANHWTEEPGYGAVRALDPKTGELKWEYKMTHVTEGGILTTASDVLFSGGREGYFFALNARNGRLLWKATVGGLIDSAPITYNVGGRQYVAVAAGHSLFSFALRPGTYIPGNSGTIRPQ
jgi:alcohol dehydrogenase (cytochrome c)